MIIVYSYYVMDIIHTGHLEMLRNAKAMGDKLIVGILTDEAAMEVKPKPTLSFEERINIARSIKYIDMVVTQETQSPITNMRLIRPDILMESSSHTAKKLKENIDVAKEINCRVIIVPYFPEHSSTQIKDKIKHDI